jgi:hypothetical protein
MTPRQVALLCRRATASVAAVVVVAGLSACAATTYDAALVADTSPATTTTLPTGSAADLLPQLQAEAARLSSVMIAEGDDQAISQQIAALWAAVRDEVHSDRPDLVAAFDQNVAMVARAVQFKRAADADKAARNLTALVTAYLTP